jgi:uncharacterized protein YrrD
MIRGRDVLRLPVITRDVGKKVGQVEDLIIDRHGSRVLGILVEEKGVFTGARVVAWTGVAVVGLDAVLIDTEASVVKATDVPEIAEVLERGFVLEGNRVGTTTGRELGEIQNFFFNPATGAVEGFELTGGRNAQAPSGHAFLPASPGFEAGKDYTFVEPSAADAIVDLKSVLGNQQG